MKHLLFSVFDAKMATFSAPFIDQRKEGAIRNFGDWVNDKSNPNNMLHKHPEDYSLFYLGEFDNETGQFSGVPPENLINASAVRSLETTLAVQ